VTYWRMQLHPEEPGDAVRHSVESLAAGFIGLDFSADVGDLRMTTEDRLPEVQRHYWAFAHEMSEGDRVLVFTDHFPFALATVDGDYNYIRTPEPQIGVWFRHFRKVREVRYYADFVTNAHDWETLTMTATITPLRERSSRSYQLIEEMIDWMAQPTPASL
jgi:hypothetical protein